MIEANQAALRLGGLEPGWQGRRLQDWPGFGSDPQAQLVEQGLQEPRPIQSDSGHYFEVRMRPIERLTRHGILGLGQLLHLRDVTQQQIAELKLAEALAPSDLDHFKRLNDQYGHLDGDDVLTRVARYLLVNLRSSDTVFRIGGEEFLPILPGADAREATKRLEAICQGLAQGPIETRSGVRHVTLSAGLALWPEQGKALDELLQVADAALHEAKRRRRNPVCSLLPRVIPVAAEAPVAGKG